MQITNDSVPPLVSTGWLVERLGNPDIRVIDTRPTILYLMGHIENAISTSFSSSDYMTHGVDISKGGGLDLFSDSKSPIANQDGPFEMIREVLGKKLGIRHDSLVVIYSDGADALAARFWWTMEHIGHKNMCILDGGFDKWVEEGLNVVNEVTEIEPVEYEMGGPDPTCMVDTDWVVEHYANPDVKMVFSLPFGSYYGQQVPGPKQGHIPRSTCIPVNLHFTPESTWKSAEELRKMYQDFGVTSDKMVVNYCLNGAGSAVSFFVLRHILGYPRSSVYLSSLVGWCYDPRNLPLETYGNSQLLKEPEWVFYWGQRAQSMMYDTYVRVIDTRSSEEYNEGHIPYALSLPVQEIPLSEDGTLLQEGEIADILGKIGISTDTKIVIYDHDNGLKATWLFWILEYLGHRDVSLLNGGFSGWKASGRKVSSELPVITDSKPEHTFDISISSTSFQTAIQDDKVAPRDWITQNCKNPDKLFMNAGTSSEAMVKATLETKNVSWASNVTEDGVFKPAAQLADIYSEALISQLKEIVCYSETPMEAAHAYFTLRLLGYPRVRLCLKL